MNARGSRDPAHRCNCLGSYGRPSPGGDACEYAQRSGRLGSARRPVLVGGSCRKEVVAVLRALEERTGVEVFTACEVHAETMATGTRRAQSTVFKTVQRMKAPPERSRTPDWREPGVRGAASWWGFDLGTVQDASETPRAGGASKSSARPPRPPATASSSTTCGHSEFTLPIKPTRRRPGARRLRGRGPSSP